MQAKLLDDPFDASCANVQLALAKLLGNHLRGGIRVEEAMPDHLADHLIGASIVVLGSAFLTEQSQRTLFPEGGAKLEIALSAELVFLGRLCRSEPLAIAFDKHGEFAGDLVIVEYVE